MAATFAGGHSLGTVAIVLLGTCDDPREIEQLVPLRDVEGMEKLGATLRTMRAAAEVPPGDARVGEAPRLRM